MKPMLVLLLALTLLGLAWLAWDAVATHEAVPAPQEAPAADITTASAPSEPASGTKVVEAARPDEEPIELSRTAFVESSEPGIRRPGSLEIHARWGDDNKPAAGLQILVLFDTAAAH